MNEVEKRRKRLLEQARNLYQDDKMIPAIHPRYRASYCQIYPEKNDYHKGTVGIRCIICILVLGIYVMTGMTKEEFFGMDDLQVREMIMHNLIE